MKSVLMTVFFVFGMDMASAETQVQYQPFAETGYNRYHIPLPDEGLNRLEIIVGKQVENICDGRLKFEVHHLTDYQEGYGTDLQSPQH